MKIIDLSIQIDDKTPVYPGDPKQEITQFATIEKDGWNEKRLTINSHFSTHIDAPFHMLEKGKKLTDYSIEKFIGDAIVIDCNVKSKINPETHEISPDLNSVKEDDIVFFYTGQIKRANTPEFFKNNPVISIKTAEELAKRKIRIVGLDSYTPDNSPFPVHKLLFKHDIMIVENLTNLDKLIGKRFKCIILPLKIKDADGAPCRIIAILD